MRRYALAELVAASGLTEAEDWRQHAACAGEATDLWFPSDGRGAPSPEQRRRRALALATCAECPVRAECAKAGQDEDYGIWGGITPAERQRARGLLPPLRTPGPAPGSMPRPAAHGRRSTYIKHACRCDACRQAERDYKRRRRAQMREDVA